MAKMDRQIRSHNERKQRVRYKYSYNLGSFLSSEGNLLITGGNKEERRQILLSQIEQYRKHRNSSSVVIFSDDKELKSQLIYEAEHNIIGQLYVVGEEEDCMDYDFFYRMPKNLISECFSKIALLRGNRDTSSLLSFTNAFLSILSEDGDFDISDIKNHIAKDNLTISNATQKNDLKQMIISQGDGGNLLRSLMITAYEAFLPLNPNSNSSRFNLISEIENDCVILIDIPGINYDLFAEYFAAALRSVMNKKFKLIFDDEIMLNNRDLLDVVEQLKQKTGIEVTESYENIIAVQPNDTDILKNINKQILLLNGKMPASALQQVLSKYGQYTSMEEVAHTEATPAYTFSLRKGRGRAAMTFQQDRLLLQDLDGYKAVLSNGSCADVYIVKNLIY